MSPLRPVKKTYTPTYPKRLSESELHQYLRPGLARRFSNETMILGTLLVGSSLTSCSAAALNGPGGKKPTVTIDKSNSIQIDTVVPNERKPLPMMGKSTRTDPNLQAKVDRLVEEVLGSQRGGGWNESSRVWRYRLISDNPMIRVPLVSISFGNSIMGIFNVGEAKKVTMKLFEAYGISLDAPVYVEGEGYQFEADGFNAELGVGFEIRSGDVPQMWWTPRFAEKQSGEEFLGDSEMVELEKDVNHDKIDMFVCNPYTLYDGDQKMAMSYYLASLIDYLNWIHGDRNIDYERVLNEKRTLVTRSSYESSETRVLWKPGSSDDDTLNAWSVEKGSLEVEQLQDMPGLKIYLEPGASAIYRSSGSTPKWASDNYGRIFLRLSMKLIEPVGVPVDVDLYLNGDPKTRSRHTYLPEDKGPFDARPEGYFADEKGLLQTLSLTNVNRFPITLHLTRVAVQD